MKVERITPAGQEDVYNMEVEDTHDFAVNGGVIVHNCRYVCMKNLISPRPKEEIPPRPYNPLDTEETRSYDRYDFYRRFNR